MAIRITPHTLSVADWSNPFEDPIRRQFVPLRASLLPDHPKLTLDSLGEEHDSPVKGLVHRYPDKALFLGKSRYCRFQVLLRSLTASQLLQFAMSIAVSVSYNPNRRYNYNN